MKTIFTYLFFFCSLFSFSQTQITDIRTSDYEQSSYPKNFFELNDNIYFTAETEHFGREIWVADSSTPNKARLLKDIGLEGLNGVGSTTSMIAFNNNIYFFANDHKSFLSDLWKSDGTEEGTVKITESLNATNFDKLIVFNNHIYFYSDRKLWKSDGTKSGTIVVKDNLPYIHPIFFFINTFNNNIIFNINGTFWKSDGTTEGTIEIPTTSATTITNFNYTSVKATHIVFNNELYFITGENFNTLQLTKIDETLSNVKIIKTLDHYSSTIKSSSILKINNKLYFSLVYRSTNGNGEQFEIWETDGTADNTKTIYIYGSPKYFIPSNIIADNENLLFTTGNEKGETILLSLNVNSLDKTNLKTLTGEAPNFNQSINLDYLTTSLIKIKNKILISLPIKEKLNATESWVYDLDTKNTDRASYIDNIQFSPVNTGKIEAYLFNNYIYFSKSTKKTGFELFKSGGTEETTSMIKNINASKSGLNSFINKPKVINKKLLFNTRNAEVNGDEYMVYDNDINQVNFLKRVENKPINPYTNTNIKINNVLYFASRSTDNEIKIWKTEGNSSNTILLATKKMDGEYFGIQNMILKDGEFYILVQNSNSSPQKKQFFKLENDKLLLLKDNMSNNISSMKLLNNELLLFTRYGPSIYKFNTINNQLINIKNFNSISRDKLEINNTLFFTAESQEHPNEIELYKTDGTELGTTLVKNIEPNFSSNPERFINNNGILYFSAETSTTGGELWSSDGTEAGTKLIKDINPGNEDAITTFNNYGNSPFETLAGEVYFAANNGVNGTELWKSDGTETGTVLIKDINIGSESSNPKQLTRIGNTIYFQAYNPAYGTELWETDGTESGTVLVSDVIPGKIGSNPFNIVNIDKDIFFVAFTISSGRQIWKLENEASLRIKDIELDDTTFIYPNPSSSFISIKTNDTLENIKIYNLTGQLIKSLPALKDKKIDISQLVKGVYLIKYEVKGIQSFKKFIKD